MVYMYLVDHIKVKEHLRKLLKLKKITPNVGKKFAFEGKGVMVNLLGQVVAKGAGSIDASSLANGVYYIVIDGVASKVIVK